jgi:hypothetical protein
MTRYLAQPLMTTSLNRGKSVECFLGGGQRGDTPTIRWVSIRRNGDQIEATLWEAEDVGNAEYLDIYSFPTVGDEPDHPIARASFTGLQDAIAHARTVWGADPKRFVNQGVIQDEYADYFGSRRSNLG